MKPVRELPNLDSAPPKQDKNDLQDKQNNEGQSKKAWGERKNKPEQTQKGKAPASSSVKGVGLKGFEFDLKGLPIKSTGVKDSDVKGKAVAFSYAAAMKKNIPVPRPKLDPWPSALPGTFLPASTIETSGSGKKKKEKYGLVKTEEASMPAQTTEASAYVRTEKPFIPVPTAQEFVPGKPFMVEGNQPYHTYRQPAAGVDTEHSRLPAGVDAEPPQLAHKVITHAEKTINTSAFHHQAEGTQASVENNTTTGGLSPLLTTTAGDSFLSTTSGTSPTHLSATGNWPLLIKNNAVSLENTASTSIDLFDPTSGPYSSLLGSANASLPLSATAADASASLLNVTSATAGNMGKKSKSKRTVGYKPKGKNQDGVPGSSKDAGPSTTGKPAAGSSKDAAPGEHKNDGPSSTGNPVTSNTKGATPGESKNAVPIPTGTAVTVSAKAAGEMVAGSSSENASTAGPSHSQGPAQQTTSEPVTSFAPSDHSGNRADTIASGVIAERTANVLSSPQRRYIESEIRRGWALGVVRAHDEGQFK